MIFCYDGSHHEFSVPTSKEQPVHKVNRRKLRKLLKEISIKAREYKIGYLSKFSNNRMNHVRGIYTETKDTYSSISIDQFRKHNHSKTSE